ncbi:MAG TPA: carboxymuconolactone decarboxylase family protein [Acidimicrobiales bacterium]|nr:carboxymuconolactone decarboxylase family protein [Acidimicrobiales bacterium]
MTDSRLPYLRREQLDDSGMALWDAITATRGASVVGGEGGLVGPFNAWVHAPGVGARMSALGATLRFETSIDRRLLELAIITVGAHWRAEFEWWAHSRMAREAGVTDEVIEAIREGRVPSFADPAEGVVHAVASQLAATGGLADATYGEAHRLLGDRGLVELVSLCGYYTLVSFTLNAFRVPLPPGVAPAWPS